MGDGGCRSVGVIDEVIEVREEIRARYEDLTNGNSFMATIAH